MSVKFHHAGKISDSELTLKGLNLLGHAQLIELFIGSQCGGHGKCGMDRLQISLEMMEKVSPPTAIEYAQLSTEELKKGIRLACQCFPNEDHSEIDVNVLTIS